VDACLPVCMLTRLSLGCRKRTSSLMAKAQDREEAGEGPGQPSS